MYSIQCSTLCAFLMKSGRRQSKSKISKTFFSIISSSQFIEINICFVSCPCLLVKGAYNNMCMHVDIKPVCWIPSWDVIYHSFLLQLVFLLFLYVYSKSIHLWQLMKWWKGGEVSLKQSNDCPWFSCLQQPSHMGEGAEEEAAGPRPTQTQPWILSTELSAKTPVLCEGRKKGRIGWEEERRLDWETLMGLCHIAWVSGPGSKALLTLH